MATNERYEYKGTNRHGKLIAGVHTGDPGDLVEPAYEARWRDLTVTDPEGIEVGGISVVDGVRTWWSGF
jgi:hypothetical protein